MGKIVVSENVSLDGVIQDPAGDEGFRVGGWVGLIGNSPRLAKLALDEALAARAFLLGRRSYEWLAARWPSRSGELEHDLVDELRLKVFPVVLGAGERLFGATSDKKPMHLCDPQAVDGGVVYLTYQPVRHA